VKILLWSREGKVAVVVAGKDISAASVLLLAVIWPHSRLPPLGYVIGQSGRKTRWEHEIYRLDNGR
jgi:hypothetical protein